MKKRSEDSPYSAPRSGGSRRRRRNKGGRRGGEPGHAHSATSHPTGRNALLATRKWLLESHGPVCAYCAGRFTARAMTLDHVAPRKGQTAYDRRDNLVLACPACNALKRDMAPLAFLLARRSRAANLLKYGTHLSPMLVDLARSLVPGASESELRDRWGDLLEPDAQSPYRD